MLSGEAQTWRQPPVQSSLIFASLVSTSNGSFCISTPRHVAVPARRWRWRGAVERLAGRRNQGFLKRRLVQNGEIRLGGRMLRLFASKPLGNLDLRPVARLVLGTCQTGVDLSVTLLGLKYWVLRGGDPCRLKLGCGVLDVPQLGKRRRCGDGMQKEAAKPPAFSGRRDQKVADGKEYMSFQDS